jgi:hypothetical protein
MSLAPGRRPVLCPCTDHLIASRKDANDEERNDARLGADKINLHPSAASDLYALRTTLAYSCSLICSSATDQYRPYLVAVCPYLVLAWLGLSVFFSSCVRAVLVMDLARTQDGANEQCQKES